MNSHYIPSNEKLVYFSLHYVIPFHSIRVTDLMFFSTCVVQIYHKTIGDNFWLLKYAIQCHEMLMIIVVIVDESCQRDKVLELFFCC